LSFHLFHVIDENSRGINNASIALMIDDTQELKMKTNVDGYATFIKIRYGGVGSIIDHLDYEIWTDNIQIHTDKRIQFIEVVLESKIIADVPEAEDDTDYSIVMVLLVVILIIILSFIILFAILILRKRKQEMD